MKIPLFDLDGTLLKSGRGNKPHRSAFDYALKTVYGLPNASFFDIVADGMIDNRILTTIAMQHGVNEKEAIDKLPQAVSAMIRYFDAHKDEEPSKPGDGARELLEKLEPLTPCGVLTGNIESIGWQKLEQAGLRKYIFFGSFGNMAMERVDLIQIAHKKYEEKYGEKRPVTDFVILGDTPKDILCAKEGGISVIAIATGNYTKGELEKEHPDIVLESLKEKEKIISFLQNS